MLCFISFTFCFSAEKDQLQRNFWSLQDVHINEGSLFFLLWKTPGNKHGNETIHCQRVARWKICTRKSEQAEEPKTDCLLFSQLQSLPPHRQQNYLITAVHVLRTHISLHASGERRLGAMCVQQRMMSSCCTALWYDLHLEMQYSVEVWRPWVCAGLFAPIKAPDVYSLLLLPMPPMWSSVVP